MNTVVNRCGPVFRHYKGNKYAVVGVAQHSETLGKMVVYKALDTNDQLWVRPYNMFFEKIYVDGKVVPRFRRVKD